MKKVFGILILLCSMANATLPVVDYAGNIQNEINAVAAYIRQGLTYVKTVEVEVNTNLTALRELQQIENEILELERMGDPSVLINLPGIEQIATLKEIYNQAVYDVEAVKALVSPAGVEANCNAVLNAYGFGSYNSYTSGWGRVFVAPRPIIQFSSSSYQQSQYTQNKVKDLMSKKQALTQERDAAINALKASTDDTTKASYTAQINALNGAIADLNQTINQTLNMVEISVKMNGQAQQIYNGMSGVQGAANFQAGEEAGLIALQGGAPGTMTDSTGALVTTGTSSEFGYIDNPAIGGTGDPGTDGSWDVGAGGDRIGGKDSRGISLPLATEIAMFGSESDALGKSVVVTNNDTGASVTTKIVDVGPGESAVAAGKVVDLTYGTATDLGTEGQSANITVRKVSN